MIKKLGTIDIDLVETTPLVHDGRLVRFEYVRKGYWANETDDSYFRFVDVGAGEPTTPFARGFHLGSAYADDKGVFVFGVPIWGGSEIRVFHSTDLENWSDRIAMSLPGWGIYNTSVCRAGDRYFMAIEMGEPVKIVGVRFTIFFAESEDLLGWRMLPLDRVFSKERYTACPALRFLDDQYCMIYLEARPGPT